MFTYQQYVDLIRFCTSQRAFSIINIDTTFKLGKFYVTFLTYKNLTLLNRNNDEYPTFFGPIMIHLHRDKDAYLSFALELKKFDLLNKNKLKDIQCFITDDDSGLHSAFRLIFPDSQFMLCRNHLRRDFKKVLGQYGVADDTKNEILENIFGTNKNRDNSLIASVDADDFEKRIEEVMGILSETEHKYTKKDLDEWFEKNLFRKIYNHHLKIKWTHQTTINNYYTTNDIEGK